MEEGVSDPTGVIAAKDGEDMIALGRPNINNIYDIFILTDCIENFDIWWPIVYKPQLIVM